MSSEAVGPANSTQSDVASSAKPFDHRARSIRPFVGSKDFLVSSAFYKDLGFTEVVIDPSMSLFRSGSSSVAFYLQDYYSQDWLENTMIFMEVEDILEFHRHITRLDLPKRYDGVKVTGVEVQPWGSECNVSDPAGVCWHFGQFTQAK